MYECFPRDGVLHWCISPHCHVCRYLWREGEREGVQYFPICICLHMLVSHTGVFLPLPCLSVSLEGRREGGSTIFPYMYMFTHAGVPHWCIPLIVMSVGISGGKERGREYNISLYVYVYTCWCPTFSRCHVCHYFSESHALLVIIYDKSCDREMLTREILQR